jgi:hypothetical protein
MILLIYNENEIIGLLWFVAAMDFVMLVPITLTGGFGFETKVLDYPKVIEKALPSDLEMLLLYYTIKCIGIGKTVRH